VSFRTDALSWDGAFSGLLGLCAFWDFDGFREEGFDRFFGCDFLFTMAFLLEKEFLKYSSGGAKKTILCFRESDSLQSLYHCQMDVATRKRHPASPAMFCLHCHRRLLRKTPNLFLCVSDVLFRKTVLLSVRTQNS
jgi:hypothetical protein